MSICILKDASDVVLVANRFFLAYINVRLAAVHVAGVVAQHVVVVGVIATGADNYKTPIPLGIALVL